ncbi:MAG: PHP domain-containing protein [Coprococcus sp.]
MYIDFHTHGKLAKYLPFSVPYTEWLLGEAKNAGLDAICLTEHFNTQQFDEVYAYIADHGERQGDAFVFNGLKVFPGMETDIAESGHVLSIGPMEAIRELNRRLEPYKQKGNFLPFEELRNMFDEYPVLVGAGHPFRQDGRHIPDLPQEQLLRFDFVDLNGKDVAENRQRTELMTYDLAGKIGRPVVAGSDTHQAFQYGCIRTNFEKDFDTFDELRTEMNAGRYTICIHPDAAFRVKTAGLLKRSLKEIHALGGDYVSVLLRTSGESPAVAAAKRKAVG